MFDYQLSAKDIAKDIPNEHHFNPYEMNGGSLIAVAGKDFAVIASDTRLSEGYSILSRNSPHLLQLKSNVVIGSVGFHGDSLTFSKALESKLKMYEYEHNKKPSTQAVAQLISNMLYNRRFFPYYVNTIVAGLTREGQGAVYSYDPVGSYEREVYRAGGSSAALLQPLLDSQLGLKNRNGTFELNRSYVVSSSKEHVVGLIKDAFISASERDIYNGDGVVLNIITKEGVQVEHFPLRRD
jgi:20S proteasome subunit beta 6